MSPSEVTLREVAGWQLAPQKNSFQVELPRLQRGFVWDPFKVMDLWDSLLRGFPIGSMMVSTINPEPTADAGAAKHYWLLDGQQRATSIAVGFYNPWNQADTRPSMWSLKSIPILWLDLEPERRAWDVKMFFPNLVTQSHPWGYNQDGGVIPWNKRQEACKHLKLGVNYSYADLSLCFPWDARFPLPMSLLIDAADCENVEDAASFWTELEKQAGALPAAWASEFGAMLKGTPPACIPSLFHRLRCLRSFRVHLNYLTADAAENDATTADDNSLLFVRLNTGGEVLGGEELIFSLFKSAFPLAKDAVEDCAAGFMAPSKLFGLLVRLAAAAHEPAKLGRPISLRDFKKEIRSPDSPLKKNLEALIQKEREGAMCDAAALMKRARIILCGPPENEPDFCLPQAVATRTINNAPDVFLALLYWCRKGGEVETGSEEHRQLLGHFTALSWFQSGNTKARQESLQEWVLTAGSDVAGRMWKADSIRFFFTRKDLAVPVFPPPEQFKDFLLTSVFQVDPYNDYALPALAPESFWKDYSFLNTDDDEKDESRKQRREWNLMTFLKHLWDCRAMLLYAQRTYVQKRFKEFGQWELTLKDTHCPWDWDHIYPSASGLKKVNPVYRSWHDTIGNLRVEGLSENRSDGCSSPFEKLSQSDADGTPGWQNSFISKDLWEAMQSLEYRHNAIKDSALAKSICAIVLKRMVKIYEEWHEQLRIGKLMDEVRSSVSFARDLDIAAEPV